MRPRCCCTPPRTHSCWWSARAVTASSSGHCSPRQGETFVVVDVGSFIGTYLNRLSVSMATLDDGDEIQIGKFRLIFYAGRPGGDS
jgi:hypothetical protein